MAFLNKDERDKLLDEIKNRNFMQIKARLRRMGKKSRLAYFRNVQQTGYWMTRYVLEDLGTQVTLYEALDETRGKAQYKLVQIVVEPTAENRL